MKDLRLPTDVKNMIQRKIWGKLFSFIALLLCEALGFYIWGDYLMNGFGIPNTVAIFTTITALVFWITKIHTLIFDRAWKGEVTHIYVDTIEYHRDYRTLTARSSTTKNITNAIIKCESGKSRTVPIPKGIPCRVGDTVIHIKGLKYPLILNEDHNKYGICVACGAKNQDNVRCALCGHTIVKTTG